MSAPAVAAAVAALTDTPADQLATRRAELQTAAQHAALKPREIQRILNSRPDLPRQLLPAERQVLITLLEHAGFKGRDELRAQVEHTAAVGYCGCGCASVHLTVETAALPAPTAKGPIPNQAIVLNHQSQAIGGIRVFVSTIGTLWLLEIYSLHKPLSPLPPVDRLTLIP